MSGSSADAVASAPSESPRPLLSAAHVRELAARLSIRPTKQWGQNFVIDPNTIRRIVGLADLRGDEHVLEVGPGLGSLTLGLLDEAAHVTAVEIDPKLAAQLPETIRSFRPESADHLTVVRQDAMKIRAGTLSGRVIGHHSSFGDAAVREAGPPVALGEPEVLVANLPYNIAVPVVLHLLQALPSLTKGLVMVQEEVADRMAAEPGSKIYGVPSVKAAWDTDTRKVGVVGKRVFWPEPRISSGLVRFDRREPVSAQVRRDEVFAVIDAAFAQRRKTLRAALSSLVAPRCRRAGAGEGRHLPQARGETLNVEAFAHLAAALREL
ncbi:16S rRNA (adenine(1518)-N(6)/adenine(1519)-N(6))-dimethyltransferase RsmA [Nesterenkonia pannonica]|uniref:16S rRNA (adenine(1518)-N(6)/adenine(1519)-N(6))- dimethyltransferase RsmA n=1 Tax=Nesterenkonia pannonica TaxID=1548602 RepID=UPI0021649604|nr:16S rRNA (adenine(1518)-N(6)/adenine(1519)-N(6))-dimethyltransferase RsmA [Nesterenkonia pannonica]